MPITVNGVEIPDAAIHAEMQHHPAPSRELAEYSAKLALIAKELLLQEATRLNLVGADEDARIEALIEREVRNPEPDEKSCRRFFEANRPRFRGGEVFEVSHILCAAPPDDAGARAAACARAESAIARLDGTGGNFAALAGQWSDCPSKQNGGNLGQIGLGQTAPEFEQTLLAMQEGETTRQPVESRFGFHVIRLHRKFEGRPLEYEMVRDRIAGYLRERGERQAISRYLSRLTGRAAIGGIDLLGANAPPAP
jgi:peptidyl-prolyl cis-trans isomerase C